MLNALAGNGDINSAGDAGKKNLHVVLILQRNFVPPTTQSTSCTSRIIVAIEIA
jgi:hypothetical protein